ncbi:uncharacterized protein LOC125178841 [Hyalella azteca]|uniref:Uncharacterized protein LOC125178841 n=1 Tax=Hyalella azteca TaxID=294128 RepID=A0A979FQX1_HYAAZ|nr:uncharacterized protein LOC125178841 [Hyalella azteca]
MLPWSKLRAFTALLLFVASELHGANGACSQFGHSCFGAHGKRSGAHSAPSPLAEALVSYRESYDIPSVNHIGDYNYRAGLGSQPEEYPLQTVDYFEEGFKNSIDRQVLQGGYESEEDFENRQVLPPWLLIKELSDGKEEEVLNNRNEAGLDLQNFVGQDSQDAGHEPFTRKLNNNQAIMR